MKRGVLGIIIGIAGVVVAGITSYFVVKKIKENNFLNELKNGDYEDDHEGYVVPVDKIFDIFKELGMNFESEETITANSTKEGDVQLCQDESLTPSSTIMDCINEGMKQKKLQDEDNIQRETTSEKSASFYDFSNLDGYLSPDEKAQLDEYDINDILMGKE